MAAAALTEGLSATDEARPVFTAPVLTEERVLRYRLTVTGRGAAAHGAVNRHRASATVQVTVRAGPALIGVAVTSEPQGYEIYGIEKTIEATASFGEAVEVKDGDPVLALDLGGVRRAAEFVRGSGTAELVFPLHGARGRPGSRHRVSGGPGLDPGRERHPHGSGGHGGGHGGGAPAGGDRGGAPDGRGAPGAERDGAAGGARPDAEADLPRGAERGLGAGRGRVCGDGEEPNRPREPHALAGVGRRGEGQHGDADAGGGARRASARW